VNDRLLCVVIPVDRLCGNVILSVSEGSRSYCYRRDASLRSAWQQLKTLVNGSYDTVWEAGIQWFFWSQTEDFWDDGLMDSRQKNSGMTDFLFVVIPEVVVWDPLLRDIDEMPLLWIPGRTTLEW